MADPQRGYYEVAPPFSVDLPKSEDIRNNDDMEAYLLNSGAIYETEQGEAKRVVVVEKLRLIVQQWALNVAKLKGIPEESLESIGGTGGAQLRIFGSTRLGVHNCDSDIDILCLCASFISRKDFFDTFCGALATRTDVESLLSIPEAYTPVVKFTLDHQPVDMVFASLHFPLLPAQPDLLDLRCLQGLDDASVRSLNGARVAEWICRLVPNLRNFCAALRVIKHWARQRGLYSNVLGFLGGVNYAILVALVCQLHVNACPYTLVQAFFAVFSHWPWPNPVLLRSFEDMLPMPMPPLPQQPQTQMQTQSQPQAPLVVSPGKAPRGPASPSLPAPAAPTAPGPTAPAPAPGSFAPPPPPLPPPSKRDDR
mmetsp:Transcript_2182/g.4824  ORF Transcript_2182/g.4824 Transcript_2182/m.4824 type:complete len:367 (-) Transcript_2182:32-1132(-)